MTGPFGHILAEQQHLPGRYRIDTRDEVEQRRLAGAIRADDGLAVAGPDRERDIARGLQAASAFAQSHEIEHRDIAVDLGLSAHA
jgi:hypothetical protein